MASNNPTNTAPGSAGQHGAMCWAEELMAANRKRLLMEAAAPQMLEALKRMVVERHDPSGEAVQQARTAIAAATGEAV